MITLYRRGRVWWARGSADGKPIKARSLDTQFKNIAAKRAARLELDFDQGIVAVSWDEFAEEFLAWTRTHRSIGTLRKYKFTVHRFGRFLQTRQDENLSLLNPPEVAAYLSERSQDEHPTRRCRIGAGGLRADIRNLRVILNYACRQGYLRTNPVVLPGENKTFSAPTLPFTQEEVQRLFEDDLVRRRSELRALLLIFLHTGLRISDVIHFPRRALDLVGELLVVQTQKRGRTVSIPLHPALRLGLEEHLAFLSPVQQASKLLFPTRSGQPMTSLAAYLHRLFQRAGIEGGHPHRFRDTFAVRMLEKGASLYDVAKLLGITVAVAERHYAPYVRELQERGRRLVLSLDFES